jgi:hypothetical protein
VTLALHKIKKSLNGEYALSCLTIDWKSADFCNCWLGAVANVLSVRRKGLFLR